MKKILLFFLFVLIACGRKGPLIPLSELAPAAVTDLMVVGKQDRSVLLWTAPERDVRGRHIEGINRFTILRDSLPFERLPCEGCPGRYEAIRTMNPPEEKEFFRPGGNYEFSDFPLTYGYRYQYRVIAVTEKGRTGQRSNIAFLFWDTPPAPPEELRGLPGDRHVLLSWREPALKVDGMPLTEVAGYAVYRREESTVYPLFPVNSLPITDNTYTDGGLENHRQYYYTVKALRKVHDSLSEGPPSNEILLVPRRLDLPPKPESLVAVCVEKWVELTWNKSEDPEVVGYNVYRRSKGESKLKRLTEKPVVEPVYRDTGAGKGRTNFYSVRSIEGPPLERESLPGEETSVVCR